MGNSLACLCSHSSKGGVLVMKEDGEFIQFRKRVLVKEVEGAHPYHKLIQCGSSRMVLPESCELEQNRLYFLVPEKLASSHHTYENFMIMVESKGLISTPTKAAKENDQTAQVGSAIINGQVMLGQLLLFEVSELKRRSSWKPGLQTIPEIASPNLHV